MDRRLAALAAGAFVVAADGTLVVGLLPRIGADLGVSLAAAGQSVSVFAAVYAIGGPLFALLYRRASPKKVLVASLALFIVSNVLTGLAPNLSSLLAGRVLAASAAAMFMPAASVAATYMGDMARHGRSLSVVVSGGAAGIAFGVPVGTWIGAWSSWRVAFLLLAALAAVAAAAVAVVTPTPIRASRPDRAAPVFDARSLRVLLQTCIWSLGSFTFFTYVSLVLQRAAKIGGGQLALFLLLYGVCGIAGSMAAGWLTDQADARTTLAIALLLIALSLTGLGVLTARGRSDAFAVSTCALLFALYAVGTWSVTPPQQHRLIGHSGESRVILALNASALYAGVALGGAAGGIIIGSGHSAAMLCWVAAAIEIAALGLL